MNRKKITIPKSKTLSVLKVCYNDATRLISIITIRALWPIFYTHFILKHFTVLIQHSHFQTP